MKAAILLFAALALGGCACLRGAPWTTLIDGASGLENFERVGDADWKAEGGAIGASSGRASPAAPAYLVSKTSYGDFELSVEFWASEDANSGVFVRCKDAGTISDKGCYEMNIFDQRPDPVYATGGIVNVAPAPDPKPKAGGRWNTYEITLRGDHVVVVLNGRKTVDIRDARHARGRLALQWVQGAIKFRKVRVRPL